MTNYICINGKKAELTEEQLKLLGIELKANPFDRQKLQHHYYCITGTGKLHQSYELNQIEDRELHNVGNYCSDHDLMEQRRLQEVLNRLLWRYSMEHDGDKIKYGENTNKYFIYKPISKSFDVTLWHTSTPIGVVFFNTREIAEAAIEEVIKPFMAEHPEFKW